MGQKKRKLTVGEQKQELKKAVKQARDSYDIFCATVQSMNPLLRAWFCWKILFKWRMR
jgi:hypothetical protein